MLPVLYKFRFDTDGSRPMLYVLILALIGYSAWSGWRNADTVDEKGKLIPATPDERRNRAILYGVIGVVLAAVGVFYATDLTVPFLGKGKGEGIPLHTYGIMLGAGFLSAVTVAALLARREWPGELGLKRRDQILDLAFSVFIGGIVGSRELFVLVNWKDYVSKKPAEAYGTVLDLVAVVVLVLLVAFRSRLSKELAANVIENAGKWFVYVLVGGRVALTVLIGGGGIASITDMLGGGLVFQGGLIGATLASIWYCLKNGIEFLRLADLAAPTVSLGSAFGRLGCFSSGCCWGKPAGPGALASVKFPGSHSTQTLFGTTSDTASLAWTSMSTDARYVLEKSGEVFQQMVPDAVQIGQYAREHDHTLPIHLIDGPTGPDKLMDWGRHSAAIICDGSEVGRYRFNIDAETGQMTLRKGDDLGPDYVLETVREERLQTLTLSRISRVKAIKSGATEIDSTPPPDHVVPTDRAEAERKRRVYLENFLKQLP
jgi:phosphatidylglycerol:prolipoprotein diacylglycerol transferase